jgi:glutamine synthetase
VLEIEELKRTLAAQGVKYFYGAYTDVHGVPKGKTVPLAYLQDAAKGSELYTVGPLPGMGDLGPHEDECAGIPDLTRVVVLPWDKRYAIAPADLYWHGEPYSHDSRRLLREVTAKAAKMGFKANVGIEPELYVMRQSATGWEPLAPSDKLNAPTRGYDLESTMLADAFLEPMVEYMTALDWGVYSFDHEGGDGQYEFAFKYTDALSMADRMVIFRLMAKHVARSLGCVATFMPKPFSNDFGSASHINISLADDTGRNVFADKDGKKLSKLSRQFTAGVLEHAGAIAAVVAPTVNSYKRFRSRGLMKEISWAPVHRAWGENNRTLMCRLPMNRHCLEVRIADGSVNFHLGIALVLAAGLDGIERDLDPGKPINENTYNLTAKDLGKYGALGLPKTLEQAVAEFEQDELAKKVFGDKFHKTYVDTKLDEWDEYNTVVTDWEMRTYFHRI